MNPILGWLALVAAVAWATLRQQRQQGTPVSAGTGARLGALMGMLTFTFFLLLLTLGVALAISLQHNGSALREVMGKLIQEAATRNPDPAAQEMLRWFMTSSGMMFLIGLLLFVFFIVLLVSATATGAVTGAVAGRKPDR